MIEWINVFVFTHTVYLTICMHVCMYQCMLGHSVKYISLCCLKSLKPRLEDLESVFSSLVFSLSDLDLCPARQSDLVLDVELSLTPFPVSVSWLWPIATRLDIWERKSSHMEVMQKSKTLVCKLLTRLCTTYNFQGYLRSEWSNPGVGELWPDG